MRRPGPNSRQQSDKDINMKTAIPSEQFVPQATGFSDRMIICHEPEYIHSWLKTAIRYAQNAKIGNSSAYADGQLEEALELLTRAERFMTLLEQGFKRDEAGNLLDKDGKVVEAIGA
jgi:hypothetical protein